MERRGQYEKDEKKESSRTLNRAKELDRKEQQREKERSAREKEKEKEKEQREKEREKERERERKAAQKDKKRKRKEEKAAEKKRKKEKKEKRDKEGKKSSKGHSHYSSGAEDSSNKHVNSSDPETTHVGKASAVDTSHSMTPPPPPQSQPQQLQQPVSYSVFKFSCVLNIFLKNKKQSKTPFNLRPFPFTEAASKDSVARVTRRWWGQYRYLWWH